MASTRAGYDGGKGRWRLTGTRETGVTHFRDLDAEGACARHRSVEG